ADPSDMYGVITSMPRQARDVLDIVDKTEMSLADNSCRSLIICGMGGSAIAGDIISAYGQDKMAMPVWVQRNYGLPGWANGQDLVVISSYSGDTEESLSAYQQAHKNGMRILGLTSGGKLKTLCQQNNNPCLIIPGGLPPRGALGYSFFGLWGMLTKLGLIKAPRSEAVEAIELLETLVSEFSLENQAPKNQAKELALKLQNHLPVIYSSVDSLWPVARRWTNQINENAKMLSYCAFFPELCHNEIVGWQELPQIRQSAKIVMLSDREDHISNELRAGIISELLKTEAAETITVKTRGESLLARMFSAIFLGDMTSYYLALLNQVDPTPVERIKFLKSKLGDGK
ncbi:MAG: bifunctional phosphoglucose/phosphomannose isomerase, partial [bacterium]|nr:bifunctional phosphoglucose/phosphomannose isomerase [bacterium]